MNKHTFTIAQGATTSNAILMDGRSITKIEFPTMTGTSLTITEADEGGTYRTVGSESGALTIVAPSTRLVHLNPGLTIGLGYIKLVSGSAEAAARTIIVYTESYTS